MSEDFPIDALPSDERTRSGGAAWPGPVLPVLGLVVLVTLTALYAVNRTDNYSTSEKASAPGTRRVGDDFLEVAVLSRDRRSVSLVIGQALYEHRDSISRVLVPEDLQGITSIPGPTVKGSRADTIRDSTIALMIGMQPTKASYDPRLSEKSSARLFREARVTEYPMGVVVVEPEAASRGAAVAEWVIVGDSSGTKVILAPAAALSEVRP